MNKKGQIGKVITTFPIMLAIFLLMAVYLVIVGMGAINGPKAFIQSQGVEDSLLLKKVVVNGEEMTLLDGFVRAHGTIDTRSPWWLLGGTIISNSFGTNLTEAMISKLKEESLISGPNCLLLDLSNSFFISKVSGINGLYIKFDKGNVENLGFNSLSAGRIYSKYGTSVIFSNQSVGGSARTARIVLNPEFLSSDVKKDEVYIRYYYGDCEKMQEAVK